MRRSIAAASVSRTVMNWINSGSSSGPPSSTSLSNAAHCWQGKHRKVTNNGRFCSCASAMAPTRFVRHVTVKPAPPGSFPCAGPGPNISFQGGAGTAALTLTHSPLDQLYPSCPSHSPSTLTIPSPRFATVKWRFFAKHRSGSAHCPANGQFAFAHRVEQAQFRTTPIGVCPTWRM